MSRSVLIGLLSLCLFSSVSVHADGFWDESRFERRAYSIFKLYLDKNGASEWLDLQKETCWLSVHPSGLTPFSGNTDDFLDGEKVGAEITAAKAFYVQEVTRCSNTDGSFNKLHPDVVEAGVKWYFWEQVKGSLALLGRQLTDDQTILYFKLLAPHLMVSSFSAS